MTITSGISTMRQFIDKTSQNYYFAPPFLYPTISSKESFQGDPASKIHCLKIIMNFDSSCCIWRYPFRKVIIFYPAQGFLDSHELRTVYIHLFS